MCEDIFNSLPADHEIMQDLTQAVTDDAYVPLALPVEGFFVMFSESPHVELNIAKAD
jgi:hypothetical protein